MRIFGSVLLILTLTGCLATPGRDRSGQNTAEKQSDGACRQARSFYQACYFSCIGSTAGGMAYAANVCGTKCSQEKSEITRACY
jgi:hypothetical protein